MTTTTQTATLTKEQLYDTIGKCNIEIVHLEQRIPELESELHQWNDAPDLQDAVRDTIRENNQVLAMLKDQVRRTRNTIATRLEIEIEELLRRTTLPHIYNVELVMQQVERLQKEVETLRKLTADGPAIS